MSHEAKCAHSLSVPNFVYWIQIICKKKKLQIHNFWEKHSNANYFERQLALHTMEYHQIHKAFVQALWRDTFDVYFHIWYGTYSGMVQDYSLWTIIHHLLIYLILMKGIIVSNFINLRVKILSSLNGRTQTLMALTFRWTKEKKNDEKKTKSLV